MDRPVKTFAKPTGVMPAAAFPGEKHARPRLPPLPREACMMDGPRNGARGVGNGGDYDALGDRAVHAVAPSRAFMQESVGPNAPARNEHGEAVASGRRGKYPLAYADRTAEAKAPVPDGEIIGGACARKAAAGGRVPDEPREDGTCADPGRGGDGGGVLPADRPIRPTPCWPLHAVETLVRLWRAGHSTPEIATRLGMTARAIDSKLRKLRVAGIDLPRRRRVAGRRVARAQRRCLYCGRLFASSHVGNRLCPTCLEEGPFTSSVL